MFTSSRTSVLGLVMLSLFSVASSAYAQVPGGTAVAEIRDPVSNGVYYTIYEFADGSIRFYDTHASMVLTITSVTDDGVLSFTAYYHNGQDDPVFWTRKYDGNFVFTAVDPFAGTGSGTFNYTYEYIADVAVPIEFPQPWAFVFVPIL